MDLAGQIQTVHQSSDYASLVHKLDLIRQGILSASEHTQVFNDSLPAAKSQFHGFLVQSRALESALISLTSHLGNIRYEMLQAQLPYYDSIYHYCQNRLINASQQVTDSSIELGIIKKELTFTYFGGLSRGADNIMIQCLPDHHLEVHEIITARNYDIQNRYNNLISQIRMFWSRSGII